jgi:hypothetical protein
VKRQEGEHQHIISCHNKEMQTLRDALNLAMQKFESLFQKSESDLKDFKTYSICNIGILREKIIASEAIIHEQRNTISALHEQLLGFQVAYCTQNDMEILKKTVDEQIKEINISQLSSFQSFQREFKGLFSVLKDELWKIKCELEQELAQLTKKTESNFNVSKLDRDGVLKEIRIYEKTIFIIEKKIENIYTLIERIKKRGESCHKPE